MKAIIQRCRSARVTADDVLAGEIGRGLVIFLGVATGDDEATAARLARKIAALRVFDNAAGRFDLALREVNGAALVVSNFTVCGEARKGTRPNFGRAAPPQTANHLYEHFVTLLREQQIPVQTGVFGASMQVEVINDGPVSLILEVEPPKTVVS
jgi:D-tyrosyl-tRNA(Tyr) deacylase